MICQASSQLIRRIRAALRMSHARNTSIARRSNSAVNRAWKCLYRTSEKYLTFTRRAFSSAQGNRTCRTPLLRTLNPRRPRVQKRHELAAIQVTPGAFRRMIVQRHHLSTLRTWPSDPFSVASQNVHSLSLYIQLHSFYLPRWLKTQQIAIKFSILHGSKPPWSHFILFIYPQESRMNLK